jgi:hypothetical protein
MAEDLRGRPGLQQVHIIDAISAREKRGHHREELASRSIPARHLGVDRLLHTEPADQRAGQHQARVRDRPLVVEAHPDRVEKMRR